MTFTEGITLGIIGSFLTVGGWVLAMWIYTKRQKENEEKKRLMRNLGRLKDKAARRRRSKKTNQT